MNPKPLLLPRTGDRLKVGLSSYGLNRMAVRACARQWQCLRLAGVSCSLVHNKQQVLGLAKLPSEPRKRHTCAAVMRAEEMVH